MTRGGFYGGLLFAGLGCAARRPVSSHRPSLTVSEPAGAPEAIPNGTEVSISLECIEFAGNRPVVDCDENECKLDYVAARIERRPGGFLTLDPRVNVDRTLRTSGGNARVLVFRESERIHVEIKDNT